MKIILQPSKIEDAENIVSLLRKSIIEVCGPDYGHSKAILDDWLENKTVCNLSEWILNRNNICISASIDGKLVGFGLSNISGEILLLYVLPEFINNGVGKSIYLYIENELISRRITTITTFSTITASTFYQRMGFQQVKKTKRSDEVDGEVHYEKHISL